MGKINIQGIVKAVKKVHGGVHVDHSKNTSDLSVERMPTPKMVVLPMQQHIGAPCTPTVKVGDTVSVGQVIGDSDKFVCTPIHASVSGTVKAVGDVTLGNGNVVQSVTIESDGEMRLDESVKPPQVKNKDDFLKAVRASGLVGLGGAGFPTHVKLNVPPDKNIDTLIINAAECEPYITVDYRECIDNSWDVYSGIRTIQEFLGIENVVIAIEDNKPDALATVQQMIEENDAVTGIKVMQLESRYPQGAEKMMIQSATGRQVPPGKLPADVGCIVMNVASVAFIARYLKTGKPLVSRSMTIDGMAINQPKNVRVALGTKISDILEFCGGMKEEPVKIIAGGPMMGMAITNIDVPVVKNNNAILAFSKEDVEIFKESDCIRCGRCADACPMSLVPTKIVREAKLRDVEALNESGTMSCMECGCCAYSCPAKKPLVQLMRNAKSIIREESAK